MAAMNVDLPVQQTSIVKSSYDKKMFCVIVDSTAGDKVKIQFPVGAIKKILKVTGKLQYLKKTYKGLTFPV